MKRVSIYDDNGFITAYTLNTTEVREFVDALLSGTNYDIMITNQEEKWNER